VAGAGDPATAWDTPSNVSAADSLMDSHSERPRPTMHSVSAPCEVPIWMQVFGHRRGGEGWWV